MRWNQNIFSFYTIRVFIYSGCFLCLKQVNAQRDFRIVGYYAGNSVAIDSLEVGKLTHLIYCFGKLDGNRFTLRNARDSAAVKAMVLLKSKYPKLKVMLSLGGWGGCETCSDVFSKDDARSAFAQSVNQITRYFHTDGLDLDWEYPVVSGYPSHTHTIGDKEAFTKLLAVIRNTCGIDFELSFAAGGFTSYIDSSIEWKEVIKYIDFINIMSYDLVHGFSKVSGHHTPLYSTGSQSESTDHAVNLLLQKGVPAEKLVIGSAFYGRVFKVDEQCKVGLYQPCVFQNTFQYKNAVQVLSELNGYERFYDDTAQASYAFNKSKNLMATFDDEKSVVNKTRYAMNRHLGGIMFWQLCDDKIKDGLLNLIYQTSRSDK